MENGTNNFGVTWLARGVTWIRHGATFVVLVGLVATSVGVGVGSNVAAQDNGSTLELLQSEWEDATDLGLNAQIVEDVVAEAAILETEVADVLGTADLQVEQAAEALLDAPAATTFVGAAAEYGLVNALNEAGDVLATVEAAVAAPGTVSESEITAADVALAAALEDADAVIEAALVDAPLDVVEELEDADEALNDAAAALAEIEDEDSSWIADLQGWVPNLRAAVDRRGNKRRLTGAGIDIALIDSGITPVQGLDGPNKIINGPDMSADSGNVNLLNLDLFGHGTHMAGIIAGNDGNDDNDDDTPNFKGIAPDARLVNLKVADAEGNTSMAQVVAAIEWAIVHRNDNGMNIRVIALALGHDQSDYLADPIAAALEAAWEAGIVVVVAGGNNGITSAKLDSPAIDPFVISIAGSDQGRPRNRWDDTVATWSSSGDGVRNPDVLMPGKSVVSLRVPGSYADVNYPTSQIGTRFAVASGTSQATAVAAGVVALLLERDGSLTPDQVKTLLRDGAKSVEAGQTRDGEGRTQLDKSLWRLKRRKAGPAVQQFYARAETPDSFGTLNGGWSGGTWSGATWSGGTWSGATWSGATWSGATWSGATWSGGTWSGATWSGATWSGATWS